MAGWVLCLSLVWKLFSMRGLLVDNGCRSLVNESCYVLKQLSRPLLRLDIRAARNTLETLQFPLRYYLCHSL